MIGKKLEGIQKIGVNFFFFGGGEGGGWWSLGEGGGVFPNEHQNTLLVISVGLL